MAAYDCSIDISVNFTAADRSCVLEVALAALVAPTLALAFDIPTFVCETFLGIDRTRVVGAMLALAAAYLLLDKAGVIPGEAVPYSLRNAAAAVSKKYRSSGWYY